MLARKFRKCYTKRYSIPIFDHAQEERRQKQAQFKPAGSWLRLASMKRSCADNHKVKAQIPTCHPASLVQLRTDWLA